MNASRPSPFDIGCSGDSERVNLLSACPADLSGITTEAELKEAMIQKGAEMATLILDGDPEDHRKGRRGKDR
jgi:hypothetical protein